MAFSPTVTKFLLLGCNGVGYKTIVILANLQAFGTGKFD
jgi:hypothetical protein